MLIASENFRLFLNTQSTLQTFKEINIFIQMYGCMVAKTVFKFEFRIQKCSYKLRYRFVRPLTLGSNVRTGSGLNWNLFGKSTFPDTLLATNSKRYFIFSYSMKLLQDLLNHVKAWNISTQKSCVTYTRYQLPTPK